MQQSTITTGIMQMDRWKIKETRLLVSPFAFVMSKHAWSYDSNEYKSYCNGTRLQSLSSPFYERINEERERERGGQGRRKIDCASSNLKLKLIVASGFIVREKRKNSRKLCRVGFERDSFVILEENRYRWKGTNGGESGLNEKEKYSNSCVMLSWS